MPTPLHLGDRRYRVYFAGRDSGNRSHVGFVEIDLDRPQEILRLADEPVLAPGPLGCFDDHGVYPASLVEHDGRLLLYYVGWSPGVPEPLFYSSIGLAVSDDGGESFERVSPAPILGRGEHDPWLVTSPSVLRGDDGVWRMWYVSGLGWHETQDGLWSRYHLKVADSRNGVDWRRDGAVAAELRERETNIGRPSVIHDGDLYRMWYSHVEGSREYRLGYAESADGRTFERLDARAGLDPDPGAFDGRAIAYPAVFRHEGTLHLLYNGDGNGRSGFGLAVAER